MRNREIEIKIKLANVQATRRRLLELGFRLSHRRTLEDNTLFDTPDRSLRKDRSILRLRRYGPRWMVTYKGTPAEDSFYKSRVELETPVEKPQSIRAIFDALGFRPVFRYQKYRSRFVPSGTTERRAPTREVALDETPIGNFLELEGSRAWIDDVARQLGYSRNDYSTASYGALYLEECHKRNIPPGDMLFASRSRRRSPDADTPHRAKSSRGALRLGPAL